MADAVTRTHMSPSRVVIPVDVRPPRGSGKYDKPFGLWWEVNGDWRRWCSENNHPLGKWLHEITLGDENIKRVTTLGELADFTDAYGAAISGGTAKHVIDWEAVARDYDGIEIAPYIWRARLQYLWYYPWDCASGVVWRPKGIKATLLGVTEDYMPQETEIGS